MDVEKIDIVIHKTSDEFCTALIDSIQNLEIPDNYEVEVFPVEGDEKFFVYDYVMSNRDSKYKIYIDEKVQLLEKNILQRIVEIFKSDEKIGVIGVSGAINISTHGICLDSFKRCGKVFMGSEKKLVSWGDIKGDYQEVESVDGWLMATQYDVSWRHDLFNETTYGYSAQCIEFKRNGSYKTVVIKQDEPYIWYNGENLLTNETDRNIFLDEYSKDIFPLVSVIIPTYNRPQYFKLALESALVQTYRNIEVVVSDNSTEDDTENLIQKYLQKYPKVKYFRHKNFTAKDNWDFLRKYDNPAAKYVNWLMDDDLFYPEKIAFMVEVFLNNVGISLVTSKRDFIDDSGKKIYKLFNMLGKTSIIPHELAVQLIFKSYQNILLKLNEPDDSYYGEFTADNYIGGLTDVLIRKEFLRDNDLCLLNDEKGFYPLADVSTWVQLLTQGNLCWIDTPLSATRLHPERAMHIAENTALVVMCWAKLIKYCLEKKNFFNTESVGRLAFFKWIDLAANAFFEIQIQNYHGNEVTSLEKLNIAMSEALHNGCQIKLPSSVQNILKNFRG